MCKLLDKDSFLRQTMRLPLKLTFVFNGPNKWLYLRERVTEFKFRQKVKSSEMKYLIKMIGKIIPKGKTKSSCQLYLKIKSGGNDKQMGSQKLHEITHFSC